ncbi:hypothetical protein C7974DRAFT_377038 [Boeremia exigua]|uniref:uncharacterized protein n=1 Tax=Boeremia exigua TaxID=749465 RepID=UPI001E8E78CD|nr:uncharacterized protein C7974DRAFT_377038 [Boeremia exigua]KAH6625534.1 hypothetical protein C7974DRAFT_377038 [Boeremia exigua]
MPADIAATEKDWPKIRDRVEKKRLQNRLAQRNYRQNVKRRIEEAEREKRIRIGLEQQNAAQAEVIRAQAGLVAYSHQHVALVSSDKRVDEVIQHPAAQPTSSRLTQLQQPKHQTLHMLQDYITDGSIQGLDSNKDSTPFTAQPSLGKLSSNFSNLSNKNISSADAHLSVEGQLDLISHISEVVFDAHGHAEGSRQNGQGGNPCGPETTRSQPDQIFSWHESDTASFSSTAQPGSSSTSSVDERLECMIRLAREVGFDSLEQVVSVLHTTQFEDGSVCSNAQRLGRLRRLPTLLDALLGASESWSKHELLGLQSSVLRATESLLVKERRSINPDNALFRRFSELAASPSTELYAEASLELQDQLPGLTAIITTVLLYVAGQSSSVYQSRLVMAVQTIIVWAEKGEMKPS